jgi:hypothetical protein
MEADSPVRRYRMVSELLDEFRARYTAVSAAFESV